MTRKGSTRIGDGEPAVVLEEVQKHFPALDVIYRGDDIRKATDWRIHEDKHAIVVHLGGHMSHLETELDGSGGSTGSALPGEIWTVPAERKYASHARGKTIEYAVFLLHPDAADLITHSHQGRCDLIPVAGKRDEFLHQATRQLVQVMQATDDVSTMLAESLGQTISLHLLRGLAPGGPINCIGKDTGITLDQRTTRLLRTHIQDRLEDRITLKELAELAGTTTHQFLIAFRKAFSVTPGQYIIHQRLRHAQHLLLNTRKDITTIALESGFSSHSHLTTCFTKNVGCGPKIFRETAHQHSIPRWKSNR
jgi:AraC family transcriptional regulator